MPTLHQLCPILRSGDAISNQVAAIQRLAGQLGFAASAWHGRSGTHPGVPSQPYLRCHPAPGDVLLLHYSAASEMDVFARQYKNQLTVCYHNITPAEYYAPFNPALAIQLHDGRKRLREHFFGHIPVYAGSAFNRAELSDWGYNPVKELPYTLTAETLPALAQSPTNQRLTASLRDKTNWLFVGRIAPNKRQDAIVQAFAHYRQHFNSNARLLLLGSSQSSGSYLRYLQAWIAVLGVREHVQFVTPPDAELAAYYAAADVFISLSEHEGFGVPLVEAMWMDVPIIALARAAVPETLGDAGITLDSNQPDLVAACAHTLLTQPTLRTHVLEAQRHRVAAFAAATAEAQIHQTLTQLL